MYERDETRSRSRTLASCVRCYSRGAGMTYPIMASDRESKRGREQLSTIMRANCTTSSSSSNDNIVIIVRPRAKSSYISLTTSLLRDIFSRAMSVSLTGACYAHARRLLFSGWFSSTCTYACIPFLCRVRASRVGSLRIYEIYEKNSDYRWAQHIIVLYQSQSEHRNIEEKDNRACCRVLEM